MGRRISSGGRRSHGDRTSVALLIAIRVRTRGHGPGKVGIGSALVGVRLKR